MAGAVNKGPLPARRYALRPDLRIHRWDDADDGGPRFLVHDPVTNSLDQVEWPECLILRELTRPATAEGIARRLGVQMAPRPAVRDVEAYILSLGARGWLRGPEFWRPPRGEGGGWWNWLIAHYLYFRVHLWNPDAFLDRTVGLARKLAWPPLLWIWFGLFCLGVYLWLPRWEEFFFEARRLADWRRLAWMLPVIVMVKAAHELAHAYAAKAGGAAVNSLGVAVILLLPMPYANVTDAWRLNRRGRFRVAAAGVGLELLVAGLALLGWSLSPPGPGRNACLVLSTGAILSTLATNLNPGMRFDGYFLLSNLIGVENLRARSIGYLVRGWRRLFFGISSPEPERALSGAKRLGLLFYAVYAWLYRVAVCVGIAILVYRSFPKAIGLALFAVEGWVFLARPLLMEAAALARLGKRMTPRAVLPLLLAAGAALWCALPLPRRAALPAVARPAEAAAVRAARSGVLAGVRAEEGGEVAAGEVLAVVDSPESDAEARRRAWLEEESRLAEAASWVDEARRRNLPTARARTAARASLVSALRFRVDQEAVKSPLTGRIAVWESWLRPGASVRRGQILGWVEGGGVPAAVGLVDAALAGRLEAGSPARFFPDDGSEPLAGVVEAVEATRLERTSDPVLAGLVPMLREGDSWRPRDPKSRVLVRLERPPARSGQSGVLWVGTTPYSLAADAWAWLSNLAIRESGF